MRGFRWTVRREGGLTAKSIEFVRRCAACRADVGYGIGAMLVALFSAAAVLELWRGEFRLPYAYSSDALFVEAVTKNLEHGWYYTNPHLAAPFGQQLYDFPIGNALNMALHHVNGDGNDNRLVNLRFLCPNCHSQTPTYGGRNGHRRTGQSGSRRHRQIRRAHALA